MFPVTSTRSGVGKPCRAGLRSDGSGANFKVDIREVPTPSSSGIDLPADWAFPLRAGRASANFALAAR